MCHLVRLSDCSQACILPIVLANGDSFFRQFHVDGKRESRLDVHFKDKNWFRGKFSDCLLWNVWLSWRLKGSSLLWRRMERVHWKVKIYGFCRWKGSRASTIDIFACEDFSSLFSFLICIFTFLLYRLSQWQLSNFKQKTLKVFVEVQCKIQMVSCWLDWRSSFQLQIYKINY